MKALLPDELWAKIEPLLPQPKRRRFHHPGRKPLDRRQVLTGILFVLRTGIRWNDLPSELGWGSGSRCRRYLQKWHRAGVWTRLYTLLLAELDDADKINWSRAAVDSSSVRALGGGTKTGKNPTDRGRLGSKHHAVVESHGIPLGRDHHGRQCARCHRVAGRCGCGSQGSHPAAWPSQTPSEEIVWGPCV